MPHPTTTSTYTTTEAYHDGEKEAQKDPQLRHSLEHENISSKDVDTDTEEVDADVKVEEQVMETITPVSDEEKAAQVDADEEIEYPPLRKIVVANAALYLAMFLVALDRTIIATAIPVMTDEFNSFDDIGWYGSAFLLPMAACQLIFGKIYTFFDPKTIFLATVIIFEAGSALCGAAPNSTAFIVGRAFAGLGSAGIMSGVLVVITRTVPLAKRPLFMAVFGAVFGIASVVGPLLGGVFTSDVTWRWCFYINLPIGGLAWIVLFFILKIPKNQKKGQDLTFREKIAQLDLLGTAFFVPGIVCILLALQWGGGTYQWGNWRIILCFVLFAILIGIFVGVQIRKGDKATIPPRVIKQRSILAGFLYIILTSAAFMLITYYTPLWLQAIKGESAVRSGITLIPMLIGLVVAMVINGAIVQKTGYYVPSMLVSSVLITIGAGLFTSLKTTTSRAAFIGFEFLFGFGLGGGMTQPSLAAQAVLPQEFVPVGVSLIFFGQSLGGSIFISIGQNVLNNKLISALSKLPGFDATSITNLGATDIATAVPKEYLPFVLKAYNDSLTYVFIVTVVCSGVSLLFAAAMEWKSIKGKPKGPPA